MQNLGTKKKQFLILQNVNVIEMPNSISDIVILSRNIAYKLHMSLYEVPSQLQSKLLTPMLNERSKSLLAKLPK